MANPDGISDITHWSVTVRHKTGGKLNPRDAVWHIQDVEVHGAVPDPQVHAALRAGHRNSRDWEFGAAAGIVYMLDLGCGPRAWNFYTKLELAQDAGLAYLTETDPGSWYWAHLTPDDDERGPLWVICDEDGGLRAGVPVIMEFGVRDDAMISEAG